MSPAHHARARRRSWLDRRGRAIGALVAGLIAVGVQVAPVAAAILQAQITVSFGATYLPINGVASMSFTIHNPNPISGLGSIGFTDTFPAGLQLDLGGSPINGCGGSLTSLNGTSVTLSGASLAASGSCSITGYTVKDTVYGQLDNSVTVTSQAGTGNTSTASLIVAHPPTAGAVNFLGASGTIGWVTAGSTATLDVGFENPNTFTSLSGVGFSATLPAGLTIASPNGLVVGGACSAGEVSAVAGGHTLAVTGVTLAANNGDPVNPDPAQLCGLDVKVVASGNGPRVVSTGPIASTEAGAGTAATGTLSVFAPGARIYWSTYGAGGLGGVDFARLNGTVGAKLQQSPDGSCCYEGTAIDAASGRVYGTDFSNATMPWIALDDSAKGSVSLSGSGAIGNNGPAIDPVAKRLYWAGWESQTISYVDYGSASAGVLYQSGDGNGATIGNPTGVAIDTTAKRIYWANSSGGHPISYANLDGSGNGHDLSVTGASNSSPQGLIVDHADGLVFWANLGTNKISYAHVNGSGGGDLDTTGASVAGPAGLAFDPTTRRLWWGNFDSTSVASVQLDATGTVASDGMTLATPGITPVDAVYPSLLEPPHASAGPKVTGSGAAGVKLSCSKGTWSGDNLGENFYRTPKSFAYHWQNGGTTISGATASTYTPSAAGQYTCSVTATNAAGHTTSAKSNVADAVAPTVSAPTAIPAAGSPIGTTIPVKLTWTGTDAGSGVDHYEVWLSTNGAAYVKLASPTSPAYTT
ncbi:MAG TPA: PKD domain-containing protein, partial [Candidatus Limnocylindrales bacterium]